MTVFRYKWHTGSLAWIIHRVTGVALTLYIFLHLYVLGSLDDAENFRAVMGLMKHPIFKFGELGLLALVTAHALNGARLTLLDLGMPTRLHKPAFMLAVAAFAILITIGIAAFFGVRP